MPIVTSQSSRATSTATPHRVAERVGVGDHVVGGEGAHHGVGVAALEHRGGQPDRGHRVARRRLGEHRVGVDLGQLRRATAVAVRPPGDDDEPVLRQRRQPVDGALQQRAARRR